MKVIIIMMLSWCSYAWFTLCVCVCVCVRVCVCVCVCAHVCVNPSIHSSSKLIKLIMSPTVLILLEPIYSLQTVGTAKQLTYKTVPL